MQTAAPAGLGFCPARLGRIGAFMRAEIDRRRITGGVTLIARHGKIAHFEAHGFADVEARQPMRADSIFRIHSMTKLITVTAVMMLFEEGRFLLDDPVSNLIPEFAGMKVCVRKTPEEFETAGLERQITIRHLLMHTSGLPYGDPSGSPVERIYAEEDILRRDEPLAAKMRRITQFPLVHQPGSAWTYGVSHDVLGRLVELVSEQPLDVFFKERILDPLGMVDTGFHVRPLDIGRLAAAYTPGTRGGLDHFEDDRSTAPAFFSGGGGLVSTATDYLRFCQMLLNGGELGGTRLLGRKTVDLVLADRMTQDNLTFPPPFDTIFPGHGMALGVATLVDVARSGVPGSLGSYTWVGAKTTSFWIDPKENLIGMVLLQFTPFDNRPLAQFRVLAYQALVGR